MGKKQIKDKKFDRNVEISAPILDPAVIEAIHSPPKLGDLEIKHGGFRALLANLHSQDSTDEIVPICDQKHVPSYIGISCTISGYANYNSYLKGDNQTSQSDGSLTAQGRSASPLFIEATQQVNHVTIDKSNIRTPEEERKELTDKLTASVADKRRSPSPCITPTQYDRHHGAYVGARYCPLPPPSQEVTKHIPLLGIDDDKDPNEIVKEQAKVKSVEKKIASIYGSEFVEDWKESLSHKTKKENFDLSNDRSEALNPKDLVTLKKPTKVLKRIEDEIVDVEKPDVKVMEKVERPFLAKLMSGFKSSKKNLNESRPNSPESEKGKPLLEEHLNKSVSPQLSLKDESSLIPTEAETIEEKNSKEQSTTDRPASLTQVGKQSPDEVLVRVKRSDDCREINESIEEQISQALSETVEDKTNNLKAGHNYLHRLDSEISLIKLKIQQAEDILKEGNLSEEASGMIMSAVGKANLLINDKCNQFRTICQENIQPDPTKCPTRDEDLDGFWDMLNLQVCEVNKTFESLIKAKENNWNDDTSRHQAIQHSSKQPNVQKPKLSAKKDDERRKKLQDHINQRKAAALKDNADQEIVSDEPAIIVYSNDGNKESANDGTKAHQAEIQNNL